VSIPRSFRLIAAAGLGVAAVALPAAAATEGAPTIETENPAHRWKPPTATIEAGGAILFKNASTTTPHGIHWVGGPATPSCDPGVPVGTEFAQSGTNWSGDCHFTVAGTYTFWCTVHGAAMSGTITVTNPGETQPPTQTGPSSTSTPGGTPPGGGSGGNGASAPAPVAGSASGASAAALAALRLSVPRHGATVRGTLTVPAEDAGGSLRVALQAGAVHLAELTRRELAAGTLHFSIAAGGRGLRALRRSGRLRVTMAVRLTPAAGAGASVSRRLTLRR
jgi:plastocyanin